MIKILLTGANGYIGSCFLSELLNIYKKEEILLLMRKGSVPKVKGLSYIEYDGTLESLGNLEEVETVFHIAANCYTGNDINKYDKLIKDNIILSEHIFSACKNAHIICASTYSIEEEKPNFYSMTKKAVEDLGQAYTQDITFIRFPDIIGYNDKRKKLYNALLDAKDEFTFLRERNYKIALLHVKDVFRAFMYAKDELENKDGVYDIIPDYMTMEELANIVLSDEVKVSYGKDEEQKVIESTRPMKGFKIKKYTTIETIKNGGKIDG